MPFSKGKTLRVRNLPKETTREDIRYMFNAEINGCEPIVGSLVKESRTSLCATVTLKKKNHCRKACQVLNGSKFLATNGGGFREVHIDQDFLGITPLFEHKSPQFDYYFVHGLGGHAFEMFATRLERGQHVEQKMWARDLLPTEFSNVGLRGRFSTIGYNATVTGGSAGITTIESAAMDLLDRLKHFRSRRPIFFITHSLGGLVVCRTLILAFDESNVALKQTRFHLSNLVKGVVFMGTPFQGSFTANTLEPFVKALEAINPFPVNAELVGKLKANDPELRALVEHFGQVRKRSNIEVKIYYETGRLGNALITKPDSATASFGELGDPTSIDADHVNMVRFRTSGEENFRAISNYLIEVTRRRGGFFLHRPMRRLFSSL